MPFSGLDFISQGPRKRQRLLCQPVPWADGEGMQSAASFWTPAEFSLHNSIPFIWCSWGAGIGLRALQCHFTQPSSQLGEETEAQGEVKKLAQQSCS